MKITRCQNWGDDVPGCEDLADLEYTINFDYIGEPPIYWCEPCGKAARTMVALIEEAFNTRQEFAKEFEKAIKEAEETRY